MTISYVEPVKTYVSSGNGAYPFTFKVLAESDIEVWYTSASTGARVQLVRGSDFSVTVSEPGGTVTILDNAPAGGQILIERRVPIDQPTDWVNNGPFDMDLLEACLDRAVMIMQQLGWDVSSGQAAINYRGPWATLAAYTIRDIVRTTNGNYYFCAVSHTSGTFATDLAAGGWVLMLDFEAVETHATNAAASALAAGTSEGNAAASEASAEADAATATAAAASASADADEIRDWPVSTGLATDVAEHLAFSRKNLLINGGFDVWQDGTSLSGISTTPVYVADGWYVYNPVSNPLALVVTRQSLINNKFYMRCAITANGAAGGFVFVQRVEGLEKFLGRTVTVAFDARVVTAGSASPMYVRLNREFNTDSPPAMPNEVDVSSGSGYITPTTSFVRYLFTFDIPTTISSSWGTNSALELKINLSNASGQNVTYEFSEAQLEFGDTATDFEYRHPAEELALCQWYYEKASVDTIAIMLSTTQAQLGHMSYAPKRKAPTITWPASASVNTLAGTPGTIIDASARTHGFAPTINWAGGTAGAAGRMRYTDVIFNARL